MAHEQSSIPTESFPISNRNILALVMGGQLTTDHLMGLSSFFAPSKECPNLVQSVRLRLDCRGEVSECLDGEEESVITARGFAGDSGAVRIAWKHNGWSVEDTYFVPPDLDVAVQRSAITNTAAEPREVTATAILYPQLGSEVHHKKGACKRSHFDEAAGAVLVEDLKGNTLVFGFCSRPDAHQVGEVCGTTDVYYDLEDNELSGNDTVAGVVPNAALSLKKTLAPGERWEIGICLGRGGSTSEALGLLERFRRVGAAALEQEDANEAHRVLAKSPVARARQDFADRLAAVERRGRLVLNACLLPCGAPLGGFTCYHNVGQTRNSCYILSALDQLGYHDEVRAGYEYYLNFKVGDQRFASADENDQLGTILHVFRRRADICGDLALWEGNRAALEAFADRLAELVDPRCGLVYSERAIHEFVAVSRGYETYVNVMAWRGLADAAHMTELTGGDKAAAKRYAAAAQALAESIVDKMIDPQTGAFVKRIAQGKKVALPAVSILAPALFGLVAPDHPAVTASIDHLKRNLWDPELGGLYRYPLRLQPWQEHPYGGPWVTYTSWLGRVHILRGEIQEAEEIIRWALNLIPSDSNLVPEHFSSAHAGRRGLHRIYLDPSTPELWATAEFLKFCADFHRAARDAGGQA